MTTTMDPPIELVATPAAVAGFWRRLAAFTVDAAVLGIVGSVLGAVAFDALAGLGIWGRVLGFAIAFAYYTPLNGAPGGQTLGKRLLGLRVIAREGGLLPLGRSAVRFVVLGTPFFLNYAPLPLSGPSSLMTILLTVLLFGLGAANLYLIVFNRATRQGLHDLITGSFVVRGAESAVPPAARAWRGHLVVAAALLIGSALLPVLATAMAKGEGFTSTLRVQMALMREPNVLGAAVMKGRTFTVINGQGSDRTHMSAQVRLARREDLGEASSARIAQVMLENDPRATTLDHIAISESYGFDIGIASMWSSYNASSSPAEWRTRIGRP